MWAILGHISRKPGSGLGSFRIRPFWSRVLFGLAPWSLQSHLLLFLSKCWRLALSSSWPEAVTPCDLPPSGTTPRSWESGDPWFLGCHQGDVDTSWSTHPKVLPEPAPHRRQLPYLLFITLFFPVMAASTWSLHSYFKACAWPVWT